MANPVRIQCAVSSIIHHDDVVSTVTLKPSRRLPNFKPGQFMHLALDHYDPTIGFWPESRVFSIASTPSDSELTIAYAVKGAFTKRMKAELTVGRDVWVRLPYGHFSLVAALDEEIVLVAGGTGITPFISFVANEMRRPLGVFLNLVYGVRKPELFLFTDTLTQALSNLSGFKLLAFSEDGKRGTDLETGGQISNLSPCFEFSIGEGSLSLDKIWQAAVNPLSAIFYLAGPVPMINAFKAGLTGRGVKPENIRIDEWE